MTPSDRAGELLLIVRRLRRRSGQSTVPILVVEGAADEELFGELCIHGPEQVFVAGSRDLVEQLLRHLRTEPIEGCDCLYLVDCDGYGKTPNLKESENLIVTEACDMEADLIRLGAATRLARRFTDSDGQAEDIVAQACALALPLSIVRRAASRCSVSMRKGKHQLRMADFSDLQFSAWDEEARSAEDVIPAVAVELGWSQKAQKEIHDQIKVIPCEFDRSALGKDALDALYRLLRQEGHGEVRGWNLGFFYKAVFRELLPTDLEHWEVGRRLRAWESASGLRLAKASC